MTETALAPDGGGDGTAALDPATLLAVISAGDLSRLTDSQKLQYYHWRCAAAGLDPRARPFYFLPLRTGTILYAGKEATDQLSETRRLTVAITNREQVNGLYIVTARAQDPTGRYTEDVGAVAIAGLGGENLANAVMKACTKAKRRAILSLCGLGMSDETEVDDLPAALPPTRPVDTTTGEVLPPIVTSPQEAAEAAKARAGKFLFASANEAGLDTRDPEVMRRVATAILGRDVPLVRDLDAADRASVAEWIRANPEAAQALAQGEGEEENEEPRNPTTLLSVQAAETTPSYSGLIQ